MRLFKYQTYCILLKVMCTSFEWNKFSLVKIQKCNSDKNRRKFICVGILCDMKTKSNYMFWCPVLSIRMFYNICLLYGNVTFYTYDTCKESLYERLNWIKKIKQMFLMLDILWHAGWKGSVQCVTIESNTLRSASVKVEEFID